VSTASSKRRQRAKDSGGTLVEDLYRRVTALSYATRVPSSDRSMNRQIGELVETTLALAGAPALNLTDTILKLIVLCSRLRADLHPDVQSELVSYLLAESTLEDCRVVGSDHAEE
jgi:hypothetical protein